MTIGEASQIVAVITTAYPQHYKGMPEEKVTNLVKLWHMMLEDYAYEIASAALKAFITGDTKGFPPVPGQIIDYIARMTQPERMQPMEAWALVKKAASRSIYYADAEFKKLPEDIQKVVGSPVNLSAMAIMSSDDMSVQESHFLRNYEEEQRRREIDAKMPKSVRELLASTKEKMIGART